MISWQQFYLLIQQLLCIQCKVPLQYDIDYSGILITIHSKCHQCNRTFHWQNYTQYSNQRSELHTRIFTSATLCGLHETRLFNWFQVCGIGKLSKKAYLSLQTIIRK